MSLYFLWLDSYPIFSRLSLTLISESKLTTNSLSCKMKRKKIFANVCMCKRGPCYHKIVLGLILHEVTHRFSNMFWRLSFLDPVVIEFLNSILCVHVNISG